MSDPQPWTVRENDIGFIIAKASDDPGPGGMLGGTLLATCPDQATADRVSEGLQALTRLCRCGAPAGGAR